MDKSKLDETLEPDSSFMSAGDNNPSSVRNQMADKKKKKFKSAYVTDASPSSEKKKEQSPVATD